MSALDLDALDTPAIRDCLKTRSHLLRVGIPPDFAAVLTLTILIDGYRARVGLATYLAQMLDGVAREPVRNCQLYWMNGERIPTPESDQPVQRFIAQRFGGDILPFKVIVGEEGKYL